MIRKISLFSHRVQKPTLKLISSTSKYSIKIHKVTNYMQNRFRIILVLFIESNISNKYTKTLIKAAWKTFVKTAIYTTNISECSWPRNKVGGFQRELTGPVLKINREPPSRGHEFHRHELCKRSLMWQVISEIND